MIAAKKPAKSGGAPAWMVTFADLMSLLLTLFVLLLSFATMETQKFKDLAGHLRDSFGFQREVGILGVVEIGGTMDSVDLREIETPSEQVGPSEENQDGVEPQAAPTTETPEETFAEQNLETFNRLKSEMSEEIDSALIDVITEGDVVIIRFPDQVSFLSGSGDLIDQFFPVMDKMIVILEAAQGQIVISGHTDDVPIRTERYRSNWDLSSARAVSVAHYLLEHSAIKPTRITVQGYADSRPLEPNTNAITRAANRRVEIMIQTANAEPAENTPANGAD